MKDDLLATKRYINRIEKENRQLRKKIKKALDYMVKNTYDDNGKCGYTYDWDVRNLYNILKGSDSNE